VRRDEVRRPRAWLRKSSTRAVPGLRPGPLRDPARSWLTACPLSHSPLRSAQRFNVKRGPPPTNAAIGAPRGARRDPQDCGHHRFVLSARHPPWGKAQGQARSLTCPRALERRGAESCLSGATNSIPPREGDASSPPCRAHSTIIACNVSSRSASSAGLSQRMRWMRGKRMATPDLCRVERCTESKATSNTSLGST
jgi:hypothetical protein